MKVGDKFVSRGGASYSVTSIVRTGFVIRRASTGKEVKISSRMVSRCLQVLLEGGILAYQKNGSQGGISYTVAIEAGVVYALGNDIQQSESGRWYERGGVE